MFFENIRASIRFVCITAPLYTPVYHCVPLISSFYAESVMTE